MDPLVSVNLSTYNSAKTLGECLESIKKQSYKNIETIIVDNCSIDNTLEIVKKFATRFFNYGPERSAQRNFGAKNACGRYILYLDADMVLSKGVITECVEKCEGNGYAALYIPEKIIGKGFWIKVRDFERAFYNATCIDAVRFVRRDKFLEIGGFDESLTGPEDWDFDRRINQVCAVSIIESPIYHNEQDFNLKRYLDKKAYYASWFSKYIRKWGRGDQIIKKQLGFSYRLFGVFIENGKWKKLTAHPILTLGMYFLRIMVGLRAAAFYLSKKEVN